MSPHLFGKKKNVKSTDLSLGPPLNILLTNGRFPVAIDLARQLHLAGHAISVVDPMHFHVCKFSSQVLRSFCVPAPHFDRAGYIAGVKRAVREARIDLIIPLHEEVLFLAECGDEEVRGRLFAPAFGTLLRLHSKWAFSRFLTGLGLDVPRAVLCRSMDDVRGLDMSKEWALKPVFGRACANVSHLEPGKPLPDEKDIGGVSEEVEYIAQEWLKGERYCSYSILNAGRHVAASIYKVQDTIDGSSCVYFESIEHPGIMRYLDTIIAALPGVWGQLAFDFVETKEGRLVSIECNPRATSGIHLFSGTPLLAPCFTSFISQDAKPSPGDEGGLPYANGPVRPPPKSRRQVRPGMLMVPHSSYPSVGSYLKHLMRLVGVKDVTWSTTDPWPSLMQPFLLTSYYEICRERGGDVGIKEMFQEDMVWEPRGEELRRVRRVLEEVERGEGETEGQKVSGSDAAVGGKESAKSGSGGESEETEDEIERAKREERERGGDAAVQNGSVPVAA